MFPTTNWSSIEAARHDTRARRATLGELAHAYRRPLLILAQKRGLARDEAEDVVQSLFAKLLARDVVRDLARERGRLRAFLRTALARAIATHRERARANKRGGAHLAVELSDDIPAVAVAVADAALADAALADAAFDRAWRAAVFERAFARLTSEHHRNPAFDVVVAYFRGDDPPPLAELAAAHGTTVPQLKSMLHRARARFRALVHAEVAATVGPCGDVAEELRALAL